MNVSIPSTHTTTDRLLSTLLTLAYWVAAIGMVFWGSSSLAISAVSGIMIVVMLFLEKYHRISQEARIRAGEGGKVRYEERLYPDIPLAAFLMISPGLASVLIGIAIDQAFNLNPLQVIFTMLFLTYHASFDYLWRPLQYFITDRGIWILFGMQKIFMDFEAIESIEYVPDHGEAKPLKGSIVFGPSSSVIQKTRTPFGTTIRLIPPRAYLLIYPAKGARFAGCYFRGLVLLTPANAQQFLQYLPAHLAQQPTSSS